MTSKVSIAQKPVGAESRTSINTTAVQQQAKGYLS